MMPLRINVRLVCKYIVILQLVIPTMPLEINIRLVISAGGGVCESPNFFPVVTDNLGNQILDDNCRLDPVFCYNDFHWQNRFCLFLI